MIDLGFPVTFLEALGWAAKRGVVLPDSYYDTLPAEVRSIAFTVSSIEKLETIEAVLVSLQDAIADGLSFNEWRRSDDVIDIALRLPGNRMELVFRNFMQTAYQSGHWQQYESNKENRPYLMYSTINDGRETPLCHGLDGIIRAQDDPFWGIYFPPNHHNCRSSVISLTVAQARMRSTKGRGLNANVPTDEIGQIMKPGPGWAHNPINAVDTLKKLLDGKVMEMDTLSPDLAKFFREWV